MVVLLGQGVLSDLLVPAYVLFAIAIPFFVVYARDPTQWWPLIPGGILAVIGLSFLVAEAAVQYIGPAVLVLVGVWILVRAFARKEPTAPDAPAPPGPEADEPLAE
jgi:putative Mn2+ efflux pump MntP